MKVAKLVSVTLMTRVIVDENSSEEDVMNIAKEGFQAKIDNNELIENIESIELDDECPIGTLGTDLPTINKVILNPVEKQYLVMGDGIPVQVIKFDNFGEWNGARNRKGNLTFDTEIDMEGNAYTFQYVNLEYNGKDERVMGNDFISVTVTLTSEPIIDYSLKQ